MSAIVSVNPDLCEFQHSGGNPTELTLILTDKDGQQHRLVLEKDALRELALLIRGIQAQFPDALGGH
jgi:hypothetical protein